MKTSSLLEEPRTLIDELLEEQQRLTPVERFAKRKDDGNLPSQSRYYRDLIPLSKPEKGQQYAFGVDMDRCTGCKACVSACHSLNGLDEDEAWRDTGLILGDLESVAYQQTVTTACHHCVEPGCMEGCPVQAYEKEEDTGIVRHLDDQCIGCQYCVLKCPYDVPKYSKVRGIVRKCDMCHGRLSVGEAPACVQACPSGAITIRIVNKEEVVASIQPEDTLLPGAYRSSYTKPTTVYTTRHIIPENAHASDRDSLQMQPAHWPLVWMLVLTQMSAGLVIAGVLLNGVGPMVFSSIGWIVAAVAFVVLNVGLGASTMHLGRPLGAWRAFLGLRTSWMSREILAFGLFAGVSGGFAVCAGWGRLVALVPTLGVLEKVVDPASMAGVTGMVAACVGILSVFCSGMIYVDTHRVLWRAKNTFVRFGGATLLLGASASAAILACGVAAGKSELMNAAPIAGVATLVIRTFFFVWEVSWLKAAAKEGHPDYVSVRLTWAFCKHLVVARRVLFFGSTVFGIAAIASPGAMGAGCAVVSFLMTFAAQVMERYLYFTTVVAYRMPGFVFPKKIAAH
ncbi:MAG: DmsC/YnfH family molybdoenzyme membrane anchor subunit [Verrucomicrobiota bacterium]